MQSTKSRRWMPSPSMVVAIIALVIACAGTAGAASGLITGKQIRRGSITGTNIKKGSITADKIKPRSITSTQIKSRSIQASNLSPAVTTDPTQGPPGPEGPAGPQGPAGPAGTAGTAVAYARIVNDQVDTDHSTSNVSVARIPGQGGIYCLTVAGATVRNATATLDGIDVGQHMLPIATVLLPGDNRCPAGTTLSVAFLRPSDGAYTDSDFYVTFN